jgi:hypothetical protein
MMTALIVSNVLAWLCIFALTSRLRALQNIVLTLLKDKHAKIIKDFEESFETFVMGMGKSLSDASKRAEKRAGKKIKIDRE